MFRADGGPAGTETAEDRERNLGRRFGATLGARDTRGGYAATRARECGHRGGDPPDSSRKTRITGLKTGVRWGLQSRDDNGRAVWRNKRHNASVSRRTRPRAVKRASPSRTGQVRGATRQHVRARHRGLARRYGGEDRRQPEHQPVPGAETRPAEQSRLVRARDPWTGGGGHRSARAEHARSRRPPQAERAVCGDTFAATRT